MGDHPRDCPHGRQWGKCDTCEMLAAHERIAGLEAELHQAQLIEFGLRQFLAEAEAENKRAAAFARITATELKTYEVELSEVLAEVAALREAGQEDHTPECEVVKLRDELAALKGRRCEGCLHAGDISKSGTPCRVCKRIWGWVPLSAGCDEWEAWT